MNKLQFEILRLISEENDKFNIINCSKELFRTIDEVSLEIEKLEKLGLIANGKITQKGHEALNEFKIDNAIILAAGMATRFVPLSFEIPKGLLPVKGVPLVERQILQLREKGIEEIVIVVGYMKEKFEYLVKKYNVILVESNEYKIRNNHSSIYAARDYLKNSIITSSDLFFEKNIFQKYAYDSYYCTIYKSGFTEERGTVIDNNDKIIETFYGDRCYNVWVTLGYAYFSKRFSKKMIEILKEEYNYENTTNKFWADIQDEHLEELYMYAKKIEDNIIYEFDCLEELREFDSKYINNSESKIMQCVCNLLKVSESDLSDFKSLREIKDTLFKFKCKNKFFLCDVSPNCNEKNIILNNEKFQLFIECKERNVNIFKMEKRTKIAQNKELNQIFELTEDFIKYHNRTLPLCAAENIISNFANLPLIYGFQERYIMNNTYSFNMEDNFIGCEKLYPFYKKISEVCERIFSAKYTDARPFTGMHCIDMIVKTLCDNGDKMMILSKEHGGHASVEPVIKRLGIQVFYAPYNIKDNDLDYENLNTMVEKEKIQYILLAPSDLIKPLNVEKINTKNVVLLYDCSQVMGLIAAGIIPNPLKTMKNIVMFGGTHKTFPGPASGLILTNDEYLHNKMETKINPIYLRHPQMHQKISLLFALIEFEQYGKKYMEHVIHCSNYLGEKLIEYGYDIIKIDNKISSTHQIFIKCDKDIMERIYENAYKCEVTLNKKCKELFSGCGIRIGTQEIARYNWDDKSLDTVAKIVYELSKKDINIDEVKKLIATLPKKEIHFAYDKEIISEFKSLIPWL